VRLLDTQAPGTSLASAMPLVLRPPAGESAPTWLIITPDGTKLIGSVEVQANVEAQANPRLRVIQQTGELAVYSTRTGALLQTLASWRWRAQFNSPAQTATWSNQNGSQLIILQPSGRLNILGALTTRGFTTSASRLLPQQPYAYQELQQIVGGQERGVLTTW
jgi:hypothetical protein